MDLIDLASWYVPKGGTKRDFAVFANKIHLLSIKVLIVPQPLHAVDKSSIIAS